MPPHGRDTGSWPLPLWVPVLMTLPRRCRSQDFILRWLPMQESRSAMNPKKLPRSPGCPDNESHLVRSRDSLRRCARDAHVTKARHEQSMFQSRIFEGLPPFTPRCSDQKQFSNLAFPQRNLPPERDRTSGVNPEVFSSTTIAFVLSERIAPFFQDDAFTLRCLR